jgi:hypothetical protein
MESRASDRFVDLSVRSLYDRGDELPLGARPKRSCNDEECVVNVYYDRRVVTTEASKEDDS